MVRLFQVELEHYEKIEGTTLSLDGKANRLATLIRSNLGMAMQGLAVVPLFAGYDLHAGVGRIFSYDATGGRYEEQSFHSVGSGSVFARGSLKTRRLDEAATLPSAEHSDDVHTDHDLLAAIRGLPEGQRAAVILFYYADLPVGEIARRIGSNGIAVRANLARGRRRLRQLLGDDHG